MSRTVNRLNCAGRPVAADTMSAIAVEPLSRLSRHRRRRLLESLATQINACQQVLDSAKPNMM